MKKQNVLGLMLATTVAMTALAGCKVPAMTGAGTNTAQSPSTQAPAAQQPGTKAPGNQATTGQTGTKQTAPVASEAQVREGTAESLSDEKDMEAYDVMANDAELGRTVMMVGAEKPPEGMVGITAALDGRVEKGEGDKAGQLRGGVKIAFKAKLREDLRNKLKERETKKVAKLKDRLDKLQNDRMKLRDKAQKGKWIATEPADGTEYKAFDFSVEKNVKANGKEAAFGRSVTMKRVRNIETKDLVSSHVEFSQSLPNGLTRKSVRDKVLNEDGTYSVTFHSELTLAGGAKRVADWNKTIAVDGSVSGTGTITWTDAAGAVTKETKITLNGTEEDTGADTGAGTVDADAPEAEEGTQAEVVATASTEVSDDDKDEAGDDDATKTADADHDEEGDDGDEDEATDAEDASGDEDAEDDDNA
jgi:hypothetical protein